MICSPPKDRKGSDKTGPVFWLKDAENNYNVGTTAHVRLFIIVVVVVVVVVAVVVVVVVCVCVCVCVCMCVCVCVFVVRFVKWTTLSIQ